MAMDVEAAAKDLDQPLLPRRAGCVLVFLLAAGWIGCADRAPPAVASRPRPAPPPIRLSTELQLEPVAASRMGRVTIEIRSPSGATTYTCAADLSGKTEVGPAEWPCGEAVHWQREPGTYTARISMRPNWKSNIPDISRPFRVDGDEIGFELMLWIGAMPDPPQNPFVRKVVFDRIRAAPEGLTLQRAFEPAAGQRPAYEVWNRSPLTLHGTHMWGNFFGHFEVHAAGRWRVFPRGYLCGTVEAGEPLPPGGHTSSIEGYFISETPRLTPGRYRYVLRVARAATGPGVLADPGKQGLTVYEDRDIFQLTDEIVVP